MTDTLSATPTQCPTCNGDGTAVPFDGNCPSAWAHGFVRSPACPANPSGVVGSAPVTANTVIVHGDRVILRDGEAETDLVIGQAERFAQHLVEQRNDDLLENGNA